MTTSQGTLDFHILETIKSFVGDNKPFSAHDITKNLRNRIQSGAIEIFGRPFISLPTGSGGQARTQFLEHNEVRDQINNLYLNSQIPGVTRRDTGSYWLYEPIAAATAPLTPSLPGALANPLVNNSGFIGNRVGITGMVPVSLPQHVIPQPTTDPIEALTQDDPGLFRLRYKVNGKFITLPGRRAVWKRKCDLTQMLNRNRYLPEISAVRSAIASGDIEFVPL